MLFWVSATYTDPVESTAIPWGELNCALEPTPFVIPESPGKPARVLTNPSDGNTKIFNKIAQTCKCNHLKTEILYCQTYFKHILVPVDEITRIIWFLLSPTTIELVESMNNPQGPSKRAEVVVPSAK